MVKRKIYGLEPIEQSKQNVKQAVMLKINKKQKKNWLVFTVAAACLLFGAFVLSNQLIESNETATPASQKEKDELYATIAPLSSEDRREININELGTDVTKADFNVFHFTYRVSKAKGDVLEVDMQKELDDLVRNLGDGDRYWYGTGWEQNNEDDEIAEFDYRFIIHGAGLSKEELEAAFNKKPIQLKLQTANGKHTRALYVGDALTFEESRWLIEDIEQLLRNERIPFKQTESFTKPVFTGQLGDVSPVVYTANDNYLVVYEFDSAKYAADGAKEFEQKLGNTAVIAHSVLQHQNILIIFVQQNDQYLKTLSKLRKAMQ